MQTTVLVRTMHDLDLSLLTTLHALLEEQSVALAARRLHVSPSAMSRRLGRLRDILGDPLLVRAGTRMVLTPRAEELQRRAALAVAAAREVLVPSSGVEPELRRPVVIRADDAVTAVLGPRLAERAADASSDAFVSFVAGGSEGPGPLRDGTVDLDVGVQAGLGPEIRIRRLLDDDYVLLRSGPAAARDAPTPTELTQARHVRLLRPPARHDELDALFRAWDLPRRVVITVDNELAAASLVACRDLVALTSRLFAAAMEQVMPVHWVRLPAALPPRTVSMVWHPRFDQDPSHTWTRRNVLDITHKLLAGLEP